MGLVKPMLLGTRRFAAGIDVAARGITLVVLSRRLFGAAPVRVEWLASAPMSREAVSGVEIIDRAAVVESLRGLFGELPRDCAGAAMRCAMALPTSATLVATLPLARLAPAACGVDESRIYVELEPLVLAEAERVAGVERQELAVDWCVTPPGGVSPRQIEGTTQVTIAATARVHLEARVECAAMAGITLCAVDDEAHAALRAMRHAAAFELSPHEPYVALWIGAEGIRGWTLSDDTIAREMRFPALEYADLVEALRDLVRGEQPGSALVAGDISMLRGVHFTLADVGDALGCPVLPFECATLADPDRPLPLLLSHDPSCAVAFGLALRGVSE
ncbi:type IV pilus biogenesis protein PilM [Paraburkholderia dinghuensis]|uniref:Pilus assembly protein PilM n=1 Tax=Paraburkholderia dinghuensis TaxID=2305225 RepID=A0A3N6MMU1_9BURK|nr:pilus assembly protein PilM [Paraburkholderia dinghuensis]RQH02915.1 pilus assembly protein PilM [Paraburkholderia dinghuensis]